MESNHSTHTPRAQRSGLVSIWRDVTARDVERHLVAVKCHSGQSQQSISHRSPMIYDAGLIVLQPRCRQNVTRWIFFVCVCICLPACTSGVLKHHQGAVRKMHLNAGWGTSNKTGKKCDAKIFFGFERRSQEEHSSNPIMQLFKHDPSQEEAQRPGHPLLFQLSSVV